MFNLGNTFDTLNEPHAGFRFGVFFYNFNDWFSAPLTLVQDSRFQKVSGLSSDIEPETIEEGGQNLYTQRVPSSIHYDNLVLERGIVVGPSVLNDKFQEVTSSFKFETFNVLVTLFSPVPVPVAAWHFTDAYPVKLSTSDLDAEEPSLLIDTLELAYANMNRVKLGSPVNAAARSTIGSVASAVKKRVIG